uniref:winged helix-turn-helix transcriptional regulator n=1 Tax=Coprococcus catus TaxID=116085 RepID=UPI003A7F51F0
MWAASAMLAVNAPRALMFCTVLVEYTLSERGKTLMTVLNQLCVWGEENRLTE